MALVLSRYFGHPLLVLGYFLMFMGMKSNGFYVPAPFSFYGVALVGMRVPCDMSWQNLL